MQDNADLQHKLRLRSEALGECCPGLVLDAFAGEGTITRMLWRHVATGVIRIEQMAAKARCIEGARWWRAITATTWRWPLAPMSLIARRLWAVDAVY